MSQFGFELVEAGFAETGGTVANDTGHGATNGVELALGCKDAL